MREHAALGEHRAHRVRQAPAQDGLGTYGVHCAIGGGVRQHPRELVLDDHRARNRGGQGVRESEQVGGAPPRLGLPSFEASPYANPVRWLHDASRSASPTATPVSSAADNTPGASGEGAEQHHRRPRRLG